MVTFSDDGRGLDPDAIERKLIEKGRRADEHELSEDELARAVFYPGFSTLDSVDALAGRGMGLNIVQTVVKGLGGDVQVTHHAGIGTSFTIVIPKRPLLAASRSLDDPEEPPQGSA